MFTLSNFYRSGKWCNLLSTLKKERQNEQGLIICAHCGKPIIKPYDCIGHHVTELTEENVNDYEVSLNPDNVVLVHHKCHNQIHNRFGYDPVKRVYIVYGAPCAGKREYIEEIAEENDLILDIDSIYEAITINKRYKHSKSITRNVFVIRDCMLDMINTRVGKWKKAFVIGGYPFASERERLAEILGAEFIYVSSTLEECMNKCREEERGTEEYIYKWFNSYTES